MDRYKHVFKHFSILFRLSIILISVTTLFFAVMAWIIYRNMKSDMSAELLYLTRAAAERLSKNLVAPLWDMDKHLIRDTILTEMAEKQIYALIIRGADGKTIIYGFRRDLQWKTVPDLSEIAGNHILEKKEIVKDSSRLGMSEVFVTRKFMAEKLNRMLLTVSGIAVLMNLMLFGILYVVIRRFLVIPITRIADQLHNCANQVALTSREVSETARSLSEESSGQSAAVQQTSSSLTQMSAMSQNTSENTDSVAQLMTANIEKSAQSLKSLSAVTQEMLQIESDSDAMKQIIRNIDDFAFQTQLLSLNAAIEAARAGSYGAGFAVVADEVRHLATDAAEAAKNNRNLLDSVVRQVLHASASILTVNKDFEALIRNTEMIGNKTSDIMQAHAEQLRQIGQISKAAAEIDRMTQKIVADSEESAAAAQELDNRSREMKQLADDLMSAIQGGIADKSDSEQ